MSRPYVNGENLQDPLLDRDDGFGVTSAELE